MYMAYAVQFVAGAALKPNPPMSGVEEKAIGTLPVTTWGVKPPNTIEFIDDIRLEKLYPWEAFAGSMKRSLLLVQPGNPITAKQLELVCDYYKSVSGSKTNIQTHSNPQSP